LREERRQRVFENSVLRRVFGHKRDEVAGEWRKLHNEELNDLYCSPKNEMGGTCSVYGGEERRIQGFGGKNLKEGDHVGDPGVDGRIILIWIFRKWAVEVLTGTSWLRIGTGTCECGNELWGSIKCGEFLV
jgi:hypothetical protein